MSIIESEHPHRRLNALTGEWILVSPHRTKRPWQGKKENAEIKSGIKYDPNCYLCPGNERAGGRINPKYNDVFVFNNDFAALLEDTPVLTEKYDSLFQIETVKGTSRVICFSPDHSLTLPRMEIKDILKVVYTWIEQTNELGQKYKWVQIFENKGDIMGCSNPHPHGQIWAGTSIPNEPLKENSQQYNYYKKHNSVLLMDYLKKEIDKEERIVIQNDNWVVLVPYWAVWPFETMLIPKRHIKRITELEESEKESLAIILKDFLTKYDNLFNVSFPYTMGWHGAPFDNSENSHWQLHAHFYPPLLRSANVKKFMVGYELLSEAQRDLTPENAAERLRTVSSQFESRIIEGQ